MLFFYESSFLAKVSPFRLEFILMGIAAGLKIRTADPVRTVERRGQERRGE